MFVWHEQENAATAAQALADAVAAALQAALNKKDHAVLAVSGGRSPIAFFEALSQKDLNWQNVGITLVDERIVRPRMPTAIRAWCANICSRITRPLPHGFLLLKTESLKLNYNLKLSLLTH